MPMDVRMRMVQLAVHRDQERSRCQPFQKRSSWSKRKAWQVLLDGGFSVSRQKETYHYSHASALNNGAKGQDTHSNLPASGPALDTTRNDDDKSDDGAKLNDNTEGGQEANRAPHVAKGGIFCAIARLGKGNAGACDGRAASVEAIGVFALAVGAVTDPARHRDTGNGHDGA